MLTNSCPFLSLEFELEHVWIYLRSLYFEKRKISETTIVCWRSLLRHQKSAETEHRYRPGSVRDMSPLNKSNYTDKAHSLVQFWQTDVKKFSLSYSHMCTNTGLPHTTHTNNLPNHPSSQSEGICDTYGALHSVVLQYDCSWLTVARCYIPNKLHSQGRVQTIS